MTTGFTTVKVNVATLDTWNSASLTEKVNGKEPDTVGVPEITPVL